MKIEKYAPYGLVNPHGKVWDYWGNDILTNATSNGNYFGPAISGHLDEGDHPGIKDFWNRPSRPCPGTWMISSRHFPDDWQGNFLNCNVISDQCIYRVKVTQDGSGLKGETIEKLVYAEPADLPEFRPICVDVGPDGAIYFCDWSQTIIGHLQHHLRDPNRDHQHGRIYRITYEGRPLLKPVKIDGQPIEAFGLHGATPLALNAANEEVEIDAFVATRKIADAARSLIVERRRHLAAGAADRFFSRRWRVTTTARGSPKIPRTEANGSNPTNR